MTIELVKTQNVPVWALNAILHDNYAGLSFEKAQAILEFKGAYEGATFEPERNLYGTIIKEFINQATFGETCEVVLVRVYKEMDRAIVLESSI